MSAMIQWNNPLTHKTQLHVRQVKITIKEDLIGRRLMGNRVRSLGTERESFANSCRGTAWVETGNESVPFQRSQTFIRAGPFTSLLPHIQSALFNHWNVLVRHQDVAWVLQDWVNMGNESDFSHAWNKIAAQIRLDAKHEVTEETYFPRRPQSFLMLKFSKSSLSSL